MARKRRELKDLDYKSQEYWNKLLAEDGMSMKQGINPKLVYVGGNYDLTVVEEYKAKTQGKKLTPEAEY